MPEIKFVGEVPDKVYNFLQQLEKNNLPYFIDKPADDYGQWYIDIDLDDDLYVVLYQHKHGFGFWINQDKSEYGVRPEIWISNENDAYHYFTHEIEDVDYSRCGVVVSDCDILDGEVTVLSDDKTINSYHKTDRNTSYHNFPDGIPRKNDRVKFVRHGATIEVMTLKFRPGIKSYIKAFCNKLNDLIFRINKWL